MFLMLSTSAPAPAVLSVYYAACERRKAVILEETKEPRSLLARHVEEQEMTLEVPPH